MCTFQFPLAFLQRWRLHVYNCQQRFAYSRAFKVVIQCLCIACLSATSSVLRQLCLENNKFCVLSMAPLNPRGSGTGATCRWNGRFAHFVAAVPDAVPSSQPSAHGRCLFLLAASSGIDLGEDHLQRKQFLKALKVDYTRTQEVVIIFKRVCLVLTHCYVIFSFCSKQNCGTLVTGEKSHQSFCSRSYDDKCWTTHMNEMTNLQRNEKIFKLGRESSKRKPKPVAPSKPNQNRWRKVTMAYYTSAFGFFRSQDF